jgi:hypothetical protein
MLQAADREHNNKLQPDTHSHVLPLTRQHELKRRLPYLLAKSLQGGS